MLVSKESAIFLSGICRCRENIVLALRLKGEGGGGTGRFFSHYMTVNKKNIENYGQQFISKKKDSGDFPTSKRDETKPFLQNSRNCLPDGFKPSHL